MPLKEDQQGEVLRELAAAMDRLRKAEVDVRAAALKARQLDVSIARIAQVGGVSRDRAYGWLKGADQQSGVGEEGT